MGDARRLKNEREQLRTALRALVDALPRCNNGSCQSPATHANQHLWTRRADPLLFFGCDRCARLGYAHTELDYADELRAAAALLQRAGWPPRENAPDP